MNAIKIMLICCIISHSCSSSISHPTWAITLQGQWRQSNVIAPLGPCQPCSYSLNLDHNEAIFTIWNTEKAEQKQRYELERVSQQIEINFVSKTIHLEGTLKDDQAWKIKIKVQVNLIDGISYNYIVQIPVIGLYIQQQQTTNKLQILLKSLIFALISSTLLPIKSQVLQTSMLQTHNRTSIISLYMHTQTVVTICAVTAIIAIQYIYYEPSYVWKFVYYACFGSCFIVSLVHSTYNIAIIQNKLNHYLYRNNLFKFAIMILAIFCGLIGYPLFLATFSKGVWFFYFTSFGLILQIFMAYYGRLLPYNKFIILYSISIVYLAVLTDSYPVLNFNQLSILEIVFFNFYLVVGLLLGVCLLRKTGNLENISDMFQLEPKKRQSRSTDAGEISGQEKQKRDFQNIKSDFELDENRSI